jgi:ATP-dependent Clp protease ATP-binding subunit ClpA
MLSSELEYCLNEAFQKAREAQHEFITVEHLLLALLDTPQVLEILNACGTDVSQLRRDLMEFVTESTPRLREDDDAEDIDVQPTLGFQRVLQRSVFHVQSSGRKEVTPTNVLVAIFSEKQSQAVYLLGLHDVARLDVVNYISHGFSSLQESGTDGETEGEAGTGDREYRGDSARAFHEQLERAGRSGPYRSADRPRTRDRTYRSDSLPAP